MTRLTTPRISMLGYSMVSFEFPYVSSQSAMALVVGMQVGSGIFSSPGGVVASVGSVGASLVVWFLSGLLAWTGAR